LFKSLIEPLHNPREGGTNYRRGENKIGYIKRNANCHLLPFLTVQMSEEPGI